MHRSRSTNAVRLAALSLLVVGSACAYTPRPSVHDQIAAALDSAGRDTTQLDGPVVRITTESDYGSFRRIVTRLRAAEDAYVAVVNVSPAGYVQVVFPEVPNEHFRLAAGKSYILPSQFVGYELQSLAPAGALGRRFVWYGRSVNARSGASGPGYLFVVASRLPLNLEALEGAGYFDGLEVGSTLGDLDPDAVIPPVALLAVGFSARGGVDIDLARYSGYDAVAYAMSPFSSQYGGYSPYSGGGCGVGYRLFGPTPVTAWDPAFLGGNCSLYDLQRIRESGRIRPPRVSWPPVKPDSAARPPQRPVTPGSPPTDSVATPRGRRVKPVPPVSDTAVSAPSRIIRSDIAAQRWPVSGAVHGAPAGADDGDIIVLPRGRRRTGVEVRDRLSEPAGDVRQRYQSRATDDGAPRRRAIGERPDAAERPTTTGRPRPVDDGGNRAPAPVERAPAPATAPRRDPAEAPQPQRPTRPMPQPVARDTGTPGR